MRRTRSGNYWITSIVVTTIWKTEVNICRSRHSAIFKTASTYLSTIISRIFPVTHPSSGIYGRRRQVNSAGRGGRVGRGGRFGGRGCRVRGCQGGRRVRGKGNINQSGNGVNVSDPTRLYGKEEFSRLSCDNQQLTLKDIYGNYRVITLFSPW